MTTLKEYAARVEARLEQLLPGGVVVNDAMRYSVMAGGKRLRPSMLLAAADMLGGAEEALDFACAVEMIHTYSLIHDDLPGMDDDTLRRGRPTNHVVYGVGQAILAGDGLLNYAFETMLAASLKEAGRARPCLEAMAEIARGAGVTGMILGQCLDLDSEKNGVPLKSANRRLRTYSAARRPACSSIRCAPPAASAARTRARSRRSRNTAPRSACSFRPRTIYSTSSATPQKWARRSARMKRAAN